MQLDPSTARSMARINYRRTGMLALILVVAERINDQGCSFSPWQAPRRAKLTARWRCRQSNTRTPPSEASILPTVVSQRREEGEHDDGFLTPDYAAGRSNFVVARPLRKMVTTDNHLTKTRRSRVLTHAVQLPNPDFYSRLDPVAHQMARTEVVGDGA